MRHDRCVRARIRLCKEGCDVPVLPPSPETDVFLFGGGYSLCSGTWVRRLYVCGDSTKRVLSRLGSIPEALQKDFLTL
eukprot:2820225-Prymnesium_polylepis.1